MSVYSLRKMESKKMGKRKEPYRVTIVVADRKEVLASATCTSVDKDHTEVKLAVNPVVNFLALRDLFEAIAEQLETSYYNSAAMPVPPEVEGLLEELAHQWDEIAGHPF
jgi:hypothetical protein